jgi:hypothetical protein
VNNVASAFDTGAMMERRDFGSSESGGFNETTEEYKANPTIENYVKLRRANPSAEIRSWRHRRL